MGIKRARLNPNGQDFRQHIQWYYNNFVRFYELSEGLRRGTRQRAVDLSSWQPGEQVLDVCTGTGELAAAFARRGATVVGVDLAPAMLTRAAEKTTHLSNPPTWLEMDATRLDFPDDSFDITTISLALHHMPEETQLRVLREMRRVTRRKIVILEPHAPRNHRLWAAWALVASVIDESEWMGYWVRQDFRQTCERAGLAVEHEETHTFAIHRFTVCSP